MEEITPMEEIAKKAFLLFRLQMWRDDGKTWEEVEPWEREAWRMVVGFVSKEVRDARL